MRGDCPPSDATVLALRSADLLIYRAVSTHHSEAPLTWSAIANLMRYHGVLKVGH